jgi:hypothetical protein
MLAWQLTGEFEQWYSSATLQHVPASSRLVMLFPKLGKRERDFSSFRATFLVLASMALQLPLNLRTSRVHLVHTSASLWRESSTLVETHDLGRKLAAAVGTPSRSCTAVLIQLSPFLHTGFLHTARKCLRTLFKRPHTILVTSPPDCVLHRGNRMTATAPHDLLTAQ